MHSCKRTRRRTLRARAGFGLSFHACDELAAYTCYGRIPFTDNRFDLYWIASDPEASNKGIASQLLAISEAHIRELGGKKLYADTSSREVYVPAHRFYEKCGFIRESVFKDFYKDGDDKWVFVKSLV